MSNLAAAVIFWIWLRSAKSGSITNPYFRLISCAFNLFSGTGYFFFSGVTNFGDWAVVISGLRPHRLCRTLLVVLGAAAYHAAVRVIGIGLVRYLGVPCGPTKALAEVDYTTCPYCGTRTEPKDYKRIDWEHLECPSCGKQFIAAKG